MTPEIKINFMQIDLKNFAKKKKKQIALGNISILLFLHFLPEMCKQCFFVFLLVMLVVRFCCCCYCFFIQSFSFLIHCENNFSFLRTYLSVGLHLYLSPFYSHPAWLRKGTEQQHNTILYYEKRWWWFWCWKPNVTLLLVLLDQLWRRLLCYCCDCCCCWQHRKETTIEGRSLTYNMYGWITKHRWNGTSLETEGIDRWIDCVQLIAWHM